MSSKSLLSCSVALVLASCDSGLPPEPAIAPAPAAAMGSVVPAAGAANTPPDEPTRVASGGWKADAAGATAAVSGAAMKSGVGGPCPMGDGDCMAGLRCVASVKGDMLLKLCMQVCDPDDDSCSEDDD